MRRRSNPWPALVDLFGALLIATFGGLIMMYSDKAVGVTTEEAISTNSQIVVNQIAQQFTTSTGVQPPKEGEAEAKVYEVNFPTGRFEDVPLSPVEIQDLANRLRQVLDTLPAGDARRAVQIVVEGHSDDQTVRIAGDRYRDNWELSSRRAASLLAGLSNAGLSPDRYNIVSVGYADTRPKRCSGSSDECRDQNRRAVIRVRIDRQYAHLLETLPDEIARAGTIAHAGTAASDKSEIAGTATRLKP